MSNTGSKAQTKGSYLISWGFKRQKHSHTPLLSKKMKMCWLISGVFFHNTCVKASNRNRAVGSSPGVARLMDQSSDDAFGSEIEAPSFSVIRMGSCGTFIL